EALQQKTALQQRLAHEPEVELLEIPDAAVHELAAATARAARPIARLHHPGAQPARHGIQSGSRPDDPSADDEDVELRRAHVGDRRRALLRTEAIRPGDR